MIEIVEDEEVSPFSSNTDSDNDHANNNAISDQFVSENDVAITEQDQNNSEQSSQNQELEEVAEADYASEGADIDNS